MFSNWMISESMRDGKGLGIYIHIPFCVKKCAYCDFLSAPGSEDIMRRYAKAVAREIQSRAGDVAGLSGEAGTVDSVFFGGGTPSVMPAGLIFDIMDAVRENFPLSPDAEISLEANPGTLTEEKLTVYKRAGVNRLSLGLQSANDGELRVLGRIHTYADFIRSFELARRRGFDNINVDLMSAVPGQSIKSLKETLLKVTALNPEHISVYSLIIEEGTPFAKIYAGKETYAGTPNVTGSGAGADKLSDEESGLRARGGSGQDNGEFYKYGNFETGSRVRGGLSSREDREKNTRAPSGFDLPDDKTERAMYHMTANFLESLGFERYEISNYAKAGRRCRHNLGYWERADYLGIGLGASGMINNVRYKNTEDLPTYLASDGDLKVIQSETEALSPAERMEEYIFLGLRKTEGISMRRFDAEFGESFAALYGDKVKSLERGGFLKTQGEMIRLTDKGTDVSNAVFAEILCG